MLINEAVFGSSIESLLIIKALPVLYEAFRPCPMMYKSIDYILTTLLTTPTIAAYALLKNILMK